MASLSPLYFAEALLPRTRARVFLELDRDDNSRADIVARIRSGEIDPVKIIEVDEEDGRVRDVTDEIVSEAFDDRRAA